VTHADLSTDGDSGAPGARDQAPDRGATTIASDADPEGPLKDLTFGQAIGELERIAAELERPDIDLDDALQHYEKGLALARACLLRLEHAELRIEELTAAGTATGENS
jgi:exodeoxyribonuclease VII small subunit